MGKSLIIKGADFSANGLPLTFNEKVTRLFNSRVFHRGVINSESSTYERTLIKNCSYTNEFNGDKKIAINEGGISLSDILTLGITQLTITPLNGYRFNTFIGNLSNSVICNGTWIHMTSALTINFEDFHDIDWTQIDDCYFMLCVVQKESNPTELLDLNFGKYLSFS